MTRESVHRLFIASTDHRDCVAGIVQAIDGEAALCVAPIVEIAIMQPMDNYDLTVLKQAAAWVDADHRAVLGTVTRTWGSAPRPVGSNVVIRADGQVAGSVSGGCIEDELIVRVRRGEVCADGPELLVFGVSADDANKFGLPCGGTLEIFCEPLTRRAQLYALLERVAMGRITQRRVARPSGEVLLSDGAPNDALLITDDALLATFGPSWRLLIIGAGQMTTYLADMAGALGYAVTVCDPRSEYAEGFAVTGAKLTREMPDDVVRDLVPDAHTAIVALTHDPKLDDLALMEALASNAFYVGAIGSRVNQAKRRARLIEHFDLSAAQLDRLHGPIGIKNGARTPPEIAVSILAEMTAVRYGVEVGSVRGVPAIESGCAL
jgi:xanthine dehydrogenase accessory factor